MPQHPQPRAFDERAALEELERLAEKIQLSRQRRERVVEEFDQFVRTIRIDTLERAAAHHAAEAAAIGVARPGRRPQEPATAAKGPGSVARPPAPAIADPAVTAARTDVLELPTASSVPAGRRWPVAASLLAVGVLVVAGVLLWRPWQRAAETPTPAPATETAPSAATPVPTPAQSAPASTATQPAPAATPPPAPVSAAPVRAVNLELTTIRPVWTRVTVDDRRVIERLVAADQRIEIGADRSIAIRAGDAGAIRLKLDGKDLGVLGPDGQIRTRTFTAPAPVVR